MPAIIKGTLIIIGLALVGLVILPLAGPFFEKLLSVGIKPSQVFVVSVTEYEDEGEPPVETITTPPPEDDSIIPVFISSLQAGAQRLIDLSPPLESGSISCFREDPESAPKAGALENIRDVANGLLPYICSPDCTCKRGGSNNQITLSEWLVSAMISLTEHYGNRISFTSLTGGIHGVNSGHYAGLSLDVIYENGGPAEWNDLLSAVHSAGAARPVCEAKIGGKIIYPTNCDFLLDGCYSQNNVKTCANKISDFTNIHIHATFPSTRPPPQP